MIHSTGSLFYSDASARALPGRMHFYKLPVYSSNGQAKPAHFKIFAPQKYLYAAVRRRGPAARTIPLGIPPNITFPPIHSNGEWGGLLIDWIVQWSVPRTFLDSVRCRGKSGNSRVSPILKTLGTRSHLLWSLPKLARVAHHSEECFVFGFAGVHCFEEFLIAERFRFSGISELTSPWDSLLSCVYNIQ